MVPSYSAKGNFKKGHFGAGEPYDYPRVNAQGASRYPRGCQEFGNLGFSGSPILSLVSILRALTRYIRAHLVLILEPKTKTTFRRG